jgi:hypothetical protein
VLRIRVYDICLQTREDDDGSDGEREQSDDGDDPVCVFLGRPAIPEEGDRNKWSKKDADGEAHFRLKVLLLPVVVATPQVSDYAIAEEAEGYLAC